MRVCWRRLALGVLAVLCLCGHAPARARQDLSDAELVDRAKSSTELRNYNAALGDWDELWRRYPESPEIAHWTASTLVRLGRLDEAVLALRQGLMFEPENLVLRETLARALARQGKVVAASKEWQVVLKARPETAFAPNLRVLQRQIDRQQKSPEEAWQSVWGPYYFSVDVQAWRRILDHCRRCVDAESLRELIKAQVTDWSLPRRFGPLDTASMLQGTGIAHLLMDELNAATQSWRATDRRFFLVLLRAGQPVQLIHPPGPAGFSEPLPDVYPGDELLPVLYFKAGQQERQCNENVGVGVARFVYEEGRFGVNPRLGQELKLFEASPAGSAAMRGAWEMLVAPSAGPVTVQDGVYHFKPTGFCPAVDQQGQPLAFDIALPVRSRNPMGQQELAQENRPVPHDLRYAPHQTFERSVGGTWVAPPRSSGVRQDWEKPPELPALDGFGPTYQDEHPDDWPRGPQYIPGAGGPPPADPLQLDWQNHDPANWPFGRMPGAPSEVYAEPPTP